MKIADPIPETTPITRVVSNLRRRFGIAALGALAAVFCSGADSLQGCHQSIGPSTGEVVAAGVGIGAVIAVAIIVPVEMSHHTLKGCVFAGPSGVKLQTSDSKIYDLEGDPSAIKAGDMIKFHGSKVKKTKDSKGDQVFRVEKLKKDYGPCHVTSAPAPGTTP